MIFNSVRKVIFSEALRTNKTKILEILNSTIFLLLLILIFSIFNVRTIDQHNLTGRLFNENRSILKKDSSIFIEITCPTISQFINVGSVAAITLKSDSGFRQTLNGTLVKFRKVTNSFVLTFKLKTFDLKHKKILFLKTNPVLKNISLKGMSIANFFLKNINN